MSDALGLPGGPAFPISIPGYGDNGCEGMSLRDYFAAHALIGVMIVHPNNHSYSEDAMAADAYRLADAMLEARKK